MLGIMATNDKAQTDVTQQSPAPTPTVSPVAAQPAAESLQSFFVPDYGVSVEAASLGEAIEKAKELKGVK